MIRIAIRLFICLAALALVLGPATPAAGPPLPLIERGVTVLGVDLGLMTSEQARAKIKKSFQRPLRFGFYDRLWSASPKRLGARADVDGAVSRALDARPGQKVPLAVSLRGPVIRKYVARLDRQFSRPVQNSELVGLSGLAPHITEARAGRKVDTRVMAARIVRALRTGTRKPIALKLRRIEPTVTPESFGPIIVIRRESNRLYLYDGMSFVRSFGVATGTKEYPTPLGQWSIVTMQRDPWWYPPPDSDWSKDLEPVPPGPGNPLGTRWMGLSAPAVGIHGTPDAASIGYSASHGCIRMLIPEATWLFERVNIGTPVFIVSA